MKKIRGKMNKCTGFLIELPTLNVCKTNHDKTTIFATYTLPSTYFRRKCIRRILYKCNYCTVISSYYNFLVTHGHKYWILLSVKNDVKCIIKKVIIYDDR